MIVKKEDILQLLKDKKIAFQIAEHEAIYTMAESDALKLPDRDIVAKNLFVRDDKKRQYFLLTLQKDKHVDLKEIQTRLESRRLSFASEADLNSMLGLSKGAVTPFGILNDAEQRVKVLIDADFRGRMIGIHPNVNTATIWLQANDLFQIIERHGNPIDWIQL